MPPKFLVSDHLTPARARIKIKRLVPAIDEKDAKVRPRPARRTEEEAHDLEQHRRRAFGTLESRLRGSSEKIKGDLQVSPQDSGLRRLVFRKRSHAK